MNPFIRNCRTITAVLTMLLATGCASIDRQRSRAPEPNDRLDAIMKSSSQARETGNQCPAMPGVRGGLVDCERVQREVARLYAEFPHHQRILMSNAVVQYEAGRYDTAQYMLDQLLSQPGRHPEAAILRARIAFSEGNVVRAKQLLTEQIELSPAHATLRETLAASHYFNGDYPAALRQLRLAGNLGSPEWRLAYHRGLVNEAQGLWERACSDYQTSLVRRSSHRPSMARLIGLSDKPGCIETAAALRM